jgi:hypothetical protein
MTISTPARRHAPARIVAGNIVVAAYVAALGLSAALLFGIQPMFAKMVLPRLGGSASVWSVAMVFFQTMLLAGYLYAHLLMRHFGFRSAVAIHLCVIAIIFIGLPIGIAQGFGRPPADGQAFWLIGLFMASVGAPFFAVAANAPLLQAWFVRSGRPNARNPYFLYGASNIGSFASLLAYPLIVEPYLTLHEQSGLWTGGFVALAVLIAGCALLVLIAGPVSEAGRLAAAATPPRTRDRVEWTLLAFVPSALLVAVTAQIATDVASAPFLWVIPLALFLGTFVLVFRDREILPQSLLLRLQPPLTAAMAILFVFSRWVPVQFALVLHLAAFFVAAMVCHGALYRRRPDATYLTGFYLWMSFGGALGGAFAGLLAPHLFKTIAEYPILLVAALVARPGVLGASLAEWRRDAAAILAAGAVVIAPGLALGGGLHGNLVSFLILAVAILSGVMIWQSRRPLRLIALATVLFALTRVYEPGFGHVVYARSFFGVHKVVDFAEGRVRLLFNGTTIHGAERLRENDGTPVAGRPEKLTYYYDGGPFEEAIAAARARAGGRLPHVALVGLGVGALACSRAPDEVWNIYEIDPELVRLSTQSGLFRTMPTCAPDQKVIVGDARLTLADAKEPFDLIILDAYSSDNIPVHLLTREAMELYRSLLRPNGEIVMNITNRNIALTDVVAASAAAANLRMIHKRDPFTPDFNTTFRARADIAALARDEKDFGALGPETGWTTPALDSGFRTWTDDYSDIVGAILRRWR